MIDAEGLAAFVAITQTGSFSRAADKLGVAQSVISKRLKRLEDQLNALLVDRTVRSNISLTRVGQTYLPEALLTLAQLEKAARVGRNLARGASGPLRVGFVFSAALNGTLNGVLSALYDLMPDIHIEPQMMETPEQLEALDAGRLDMGLIRPRPAYPLECTASCVHQEALVVGLSDRHPLASHESLTPRMLANQHFIIPQFHEQVGLVDNLRRLAVAGGFELPGMIRTADFVTAACLAASRYGVVLAPASLAHIDLVGLIFLPLTEFDDLIQTVLIHRNDAPEQAVRAIKSMITV